MNSMQVSLLTFAFVSAGVSLGMFLRWKLPDHHLKDDSRDVVKTAAGLIATLVALVIGLLVGAAKNSFDATSTGLTQLGAKVLMLDRVMARYGSDASEIRQSQKKNLEAAIERLWPSDGSNRADMSAIESATAMEEVHEAIRRLSPKTDAQRQLQAQALQISSDLLQARWLMIEQTQAALPPVFVVVLIFWLTVLYISFGMLAPRNSTSIVALLVCALSISCAVFLIVEMSRPYEGLMKVSNAPLQKAVELMGR